LRHDLKPRVVATTFEISTKEDLKALTLFVHFLLLPDRNAKYGDQRVCMSACLSVCMSARISQTSHVVRSLLWAGVQPTLDLVLRPLYRSNTPFRERRGIGRCVRCMCALCRVEEGTVSVSSLSGISKRAPSRRGLLYVAKPGLVLIQCQP